MNFNQVPEFSKELKKLTKKWRSLPSDLLDAQLQIKDLYVGQDDNKLTEYRTAFFNGRRATILQMAGDDCEVVKMRLDCESLGASDKIRLVFIAIRSANTVTFVELYAKNQKNREDQRRIKKYLN